MMEKLIQGNSAREYPTASTRELRYPSESPLTDGPWIPGTLPLAPLTTAGYSPNSWWLLFFGEMYKLSKRYIIM